MKRKKTLAEKLDDFYREPGPAAFQLSLDEGTVRELAERRVTLELQETAISFLAWLKGPAYGLRVAKEMQRRQRAREAADSPEPDHGQITINFGGRDAKSRPKRRRR